LPIRSVIAKVLDPVVMYSPMTLASISSPPTSEYKKNFIAAFSNIGRAIDLTGPGVGIISTVPGGYGVESGTSMACPAVTGFAARILGRLPDIRKQARNQERSDAIAQALFASVRDLGFKPEFEGHGLPS